MSKKTVKIDPTSQMVIDLKEGLNSPFWLTLKRAITEEKEDIENQIFEDETLDDRKRDDLRRWRNYLSFFINLPELIIAKNETLPPQDTQDDETYETPKDPLEVIRNRILQS